MDKFKQKLAQKLTEKGYIEKKAIKDAYIITIVTPNGVGVIDQANSVVDSSYIFDDPDYLMKFESEEEAKKYLPELIKGLVEIQKLSQYRNDIEDKISSKKQASFWEVKKNENGKYYLTSPKGDYEDAEGKVYEFDTETDALEEIDFLDAEHKYKKELKHKKADYDKIKVGIEGNSLTLGINDYLKLDTEESSDNAFQNEQEKQNFEKKVVTRLIPYLSELKRKFIEIVRLEGIDLVNKNASKKEATIKYEDGVYNVYSESGKCLGKDYKTKEEAEKRLKQVEYFKHKKAENEDLDKNEYVFGNITVIIYPKGESKYDVEVFNEDPNEFGDAYNFYENIELIDDTSDAVFDFIAEKGIIK